SGSSPDTPKSRGPRSRRHLRKPRVALSPAFLASTSCSAEGCSSGVSPSCPEARASERRRWGSSSSSKAQSARSRGCTWPSKEGLSPEELRQVLYGLAGQFKTLDVTSLLTLESQAMYSTDSITDGGFSPVADNIILLRYAQVQGAIRPTLAVVKTRGSFHDRGTYYFDIAKGGVRIAERIDGAAPTRAKV